MYNTARRGGWLESELKFTSKLPLPLESLPIKFEAQMLSNSDVTGVLNL